ncbi:MAG: hypothetical protein GY768_28100, partial [Planctomycetaceae bacterium]|nr:hypothetical protein [Planctomycetaceae bacterium]
MPKEPVTQGHRPKDQPSIGSFSAMVARPVSRREIEENLEAAQAEDDEWDNLRVKRTWDEQTGREWDDVAREARDGGYDVHFGSLVGIVVEKNAELPKGDPKRKFKGRVVFLGDRVRDQNNQAALVMDLGNTPATMEASRS